MPYEQYFRTATESLIIVDRAGRIVEANLTTEKLFGYDPDELTGRPIEVLLPESLRELHRGHVERYFAEPRTRAMGKGLNLVGRRQDGSEFPVDISLTYAPGTSRGDLVIAAISDITERLALEHEARMAESATSLGTFAAGIAHDLNNPLQVIRSRTEFLMDLPHATPVSEMMEDLTAIHRQVKRASQIVEEFLRLSSHRKKTFAPVDVGRLVERALLLIAEEMRKDGINIQTTLNANLPRVMGDITSLERVLINLLSNAREAAQRGGLITIVSDTFGDRSQWVHLSVTDTGPGIHPEALPHVFDLFYSTKTYGTGLGLWISRRIVQDHDGTLEVRSEPGEGTTFTIRLPVQEPVREL